MSDPNTLVDQKKEAAQAADHYLVGIGASAGGLQAIHQLFDHFPSNSSFSFVIIQHLSPDHKSLMAELLTKHTQMRVQEAEDNMLTKPNCVYVLPSGKQLTLKKGRLRLVDKTRDREPNFAIDVFFESLAKDRGRYAIGVILSGTGTDGTKGGKAIKAAGGMVVVQEPGSAKFNGMPHSAISAGLGDFVLSPDRMPVAIIDYTQKVPLVRALTEDANGGEDSAVIREILDVVCHHTQMDFSNYKEPTIYRRLQKRLESLKLKSLRGYLNYLHENPAEINHISQEFFIGVTKFFRDPEAFELLRQEVIPNIVSSKPASEPVKVWVTACSTGEEVYSLAILFTECFQQLGREPNVKLFATDIDKRAITQASKGIYPATISKDVSEERLQRFFHQRGGRYIINEEIRKLVVFAQHDLQKDPPFSRLDLITCRNMLIYLNAGLQNKVLSLFPYALNLYGYLLLGPSEHIADMKSFFSEENRKWKLYRKVKESRGIQPNYGITDYRPATASESSSAFKGSPLSRYNDTFMDAVAEDFKVTGLYVDENYQLLHGIGDISRFLNFPDRRLHFNLLKMVPEELSVALSVGIRKALKQNQKVVVRQVAIQKGKKERYVHVTIRPIAPEKNQPRIILVLLQELGKMNHPVKASDLTMLSGSDYYQQLAALEQELKEAREGLHLTVQDLSSSNEELQSSNEELMSSNEELQSSNEEMQSLNEELHTVNSEHQLKIKELQELNEDLDNYIRSSNIGQLFVDHHLVIRKFTPSIKELINIIDSDLGRPIHHLSHNLKYAHLLEDIQKVNNTSVEVEQEVETEEGRFFLMRIIPYLKHDGNKDGVVLSFVEVTTLKELSNVVQGVLNSSLNNIMAFRAVRDEKQKITDFTWSLLNRKGEELVGKANADILDKSVLVDLPFLKKSGLFRKLVGVVETGQQLHIEQQLEINAHKGWYEIAAVKMGDGITVTMADITEKKVSEEKVLQAYEEIKKAEEDLIRLNNELEKRVAERTQALGVSEERFRLVSMATNDVVWDWNLVTNEVWWSENLKGILGYGPEEMGEGVNGWFDMVHPDDREQTRQGINQAINQGKDQWAGEYRIVKQDGSYAFVSNRAYILHNEYKMPYRVLGSFIDLSDLKAIQQRLQDTNEHLLKVNADLDTFVYTASHDLKAPVANIEGLLLLLEEQIESSAPLVGEPTQPVFDMMKNSIRRFQNVIKDLTDVARVQRDVDGEAELVDLQEVFDDVTVNIGDLVAQTKARVRTDFSGGKQVNFSRKNLYSILYNLVSNAIKYRSSERQPEINIKAEQIDGHVLLTVKDNGSGISEDNLPKMFTLFKRFHSEVEGTGMGLYIVKRMMDNSGGKIEVESEEGSGTTFRLYFKAAK
ncbi:two-component system CheB/CheR fusion protein [Pontibacter ummariensis]|uniref:Two-component system, chemotaxis family, CheB/CheR fusion protein n=1 Tax=Pontibacter ummariensis TaxID=1610492 RepID=A0A239I2S0_9BACT|nr:chemotaxis protein CheB [Pontibacter ummariensis]PRY10196.1 two-component system CheB/CheR fusion protein [Pontibacter ummariensis]SNS87895.1 two-component system, chemotaxis family, CheB/CheR fusion protein [Pontibacter ummariensis]